MRGAIPYLFARRFANQLRELMRKPGRLISYVVMIALIGFAFIGQTMNRYSDAPLDMNMANTITLLICVFMVGIYYMSARSGGQGLFQMSDVNLMFVSPISPKTILWYGFVQQIVLMLVTVFSIAANIGTISNAMQLPALSLVAPLLCTWLLLGIASMMMSIIIYGIVSKSELAYKVTGLIGIAYLALIAFAAVNGVMAAINGAVASGAPSEGMSLWPVGIVRGVGGDWLDWLPIAGWLRAFFLGWTLGDMPRMWFGLGCTAAFVAACVAYQMLSRPDYYEEAMVGAQIKFSAKAGKTAMGVGKSERQMRKKMRIGKVGIPGGHGASTFLFRQLREEFRRGRFLLDWQAWTHIGIGVLLCVFGSRDGLTITFGSLAFLLFMTSFVSSWMQELGKPYILLVPARPFSKLVWASMLTTIKTGFNGLLAFAVAGIGLRVSPLVIACMVLAYASINYAMVAGNVLSVRIVGSSAGQVLTAMLFMLFTILMIVPGFIAWAIGLAMGAQALAYLLMAACNALLGTAVLAVCRNVLNAAEL